MAKESKNEVNKFNSLPTSMSKKAYASMILCLNADSQNNRRSLKSTINLPISIPFTYSITILLLQLCILSVNADPSSNETSSNETIETTNRPKRYPLFVLEDEKPGNYCLHGGTLLNGKCHCLYPFTGIHCTDFACQHGLSTGSRYDPDSIFFSKRCICDDDWSGDLCQIPIANQCHERGQYVNGRCYCHGYYFGPKCEYVGKCVHGELKSGLCHCKYGYEGDYCDSIVCHHGYQNKTNSSHCICPDRHTGFFCDECLIQDPHVLPFPNCTLVIRPSRAKISRNKTDHLIMKRILIIFIIFSILVVLTGVMYARKWGNRRAELTDNELELQDILNERQALLKEAIFEQNGVRSNGRYADPNRLDNELL